MTHVAVDAVELRAVVRGRVRVGGLHVLGRLDELVGRVAARA